MKKNILKITSALVLGVFALTSCKTVSPRKLDGDWTITSGSGSMTDTEDGVTNSSTLSYNGSVMTSTQDGEVNSNDVTIAYTFDKKAGTYSQTTTSTYSNKSNVDYYSLTAATLYTPAYYTSTGSLFKKTVTVSTSIEKGTFTITGGTGDIEKNSQIVFLPTSSSEASTSTFSYFNDQNVAVTDLANKYQPVYSNNNNGMTTYELLPTKSTVSSSDVMKSTTGDIMTVTSLKKGIMEVTSNESNTHTEGATTYSSTSNMKYTFTQK